MVVERPQVASDAAPEGAWLQEAERGTDLGVAALLLAYRWFGRPFAAVILRLVASWYAIASPSVRRNSLGYLRRLWPEAGTREVVRHIVTFAQCAFDRVLFAAGERSAFRIERHGYQHLQRQARSGRGALLLGAHVGSFEAMRAMAGAERFVIRPLVHFANARRITKMLRTVAPGFDAGVIEIDPAAPHWILRVQECIDRGEFIAILGDRTGLSEGTAPVSLLGGTALLPTGPYTLAAVLRCPVYLTFGLYHAPNTYALYCEPFATRIELPRGDRAAAAARLAQRYAERLEFYLRRAPYCWFNFFAMWQ